MGAGGHGCGAQSWATARGAGRRGAAGAGPPGGCALLRGGPASAWLAGASLVGSDQLLLPGLPVRTHLLVSQNHRPSEAGARARSGHGSRAEPHRGPETLLHPRGTLQALTLVRTEPQGAKADAVVLLVTVASGPLRAWVRACVGLCTCARERGLQVGRGGSPPSGVWGTRQRVSRCAAGETQGRHGSRPGTPARPCGHVAIRGACGPSVSLRLRSLFLGRVPCRGLAPRLGRGAPVGSGPAALFLSFSFPATVPPRRAPEQGSC